MTEPGVNGTTTMCARLGGRVRQESAALERHLRRAQACEVEGTHQARVSSRRLRELLAIAAEVADGEARRLSREARRIGRALGPLREIDTSIAVWREPRFENAWPPTLLTRLDRAAEAERARRVPGMRRTLGRLIDTDFRRRLDQVAGSLTSSMPDSQLRAALSRRVHRRASRLVRVLERAGTVYVPDVLHEARIAAKTFRYALELARDASGVRLGGTLRQLKGQQDLLGRLHDLQVVQDRVNELGAEGRPSQALLRAVKAADIDLERECRTLHGRFVAGIPVLLAHVGRAVARVDLECVRPKPGRMAADDGDARSSLPGKLAASQAGE